MLCATHTIMMFIMRQLRMGIVVCVSMIVVSLLIIILVVSIVMVIVIIVIAQSVHMIVVTLLIVNMYTVLRTMGVLWW